ncbi:adenylate/guanylate cyclase domain-containing protein [Thermodesulfobacteriota bacterium]
MEAVVYFIGAGFIWTASISVGRLLLQSAGENRNPMEWSVVDRCLLLVVIYFIVGGGFTFLRGVIETMQLGSVPYIDSSNFQSFIKLMNSVGIIWVILLVSGLYLRKRAPYSAIFAHIVIQISAVIAALFCHLLGTVTDPGPLLFGMAQGAFNLILFSPSMAFPWIVTFTLLVVLSMITSSLDLVSYAPLFKNPPYIDGSIDGFYWISTLTMSLSIFLLMLFLIAFIVIRWRDREAKLADMTALLKKMFGRYLSTEVMNSLIENPSALELGGERRRVTIMMTDLRGFTALSERLEPEQVVQMLNAYFEIILDVVLQYNGTINEIIGDALLVIFGAPQEMPDRSQQTIACAIAMQNAMAEVNKENRALGLPELEMGIGLNEAEVIVGNIGSSKRSKYAVVGSGVNMTGRIESYTVGGQILISESIRRDAGDVLRIDAQSDVFPKGAEAPMRIYEVGGIAGTYNIALEKQDSELITLTRKIPMLYTALGGKHVGQERLKGLMVRLSKKSAEITLDRPVELLTNLKMNLNEVYEALAVKDFYGKVVERVEKDGDAYMIRFTGVPPEIVSYFQAFQQHAAYSAQ